MDEQLSQISFDESDSTPGLIDSDSEDLPPTIQDINNIIDTSTPRDSHKDRGDATEEDTVVLETNGTDENNKKSSEENAADEDKCIGIDSVDAFPGKKMSPPLEWLPKLPTGGSASGSLKPRHNVHIIYSTGESYHFDEDKFTLFDYGFEFTSDERDEGICVVQWNEDDDDIRFCRWKVGPRNRRKPMGYAEKMKEWKEIDAKRSEIKRLKTDAWSKLRLYGNGDSSNNMEVDEEGDISEVENDDSERSTIATNYNDECVNLCMEIDGIDRTKKYEVPRRPPYVYDSPLPGSKDSDSSSGINESSDEEAPSTIQDMSDNNQKQVEVEEDVTIADTEDDRQYFYNSWEEGAAMLPQFLQNVDTSQMILVIIRHDEMIMRFGNEDPKKYPANQEWPYNNIGDHLRLAMVETVERADGSYAVKCNKEGHCDVSFLVENPSDRDKPLKEKRFLFELHRYAYKGELQYFGQVEPSHNEFDHSVLTPYTTTKDFHSDEIRMDEMRVVLGPFPFARDNPDTWVIPSAIVEEVREIQKPAGLGFGAPSKKQVTDNTRKRSRSPVKSGSKSSTDSQRSKTDSQRSKKQKNKDSDRDHMDDMARVLAKSLTHAQAKSQTSCQYVHASAWIIEVDGENKEESVYLSDFAKSRKYSNAKHAEEILLSRMSDRMDQMEQEEQQVANRYMLLMVAHNMKGVLDGSLCGMCVCALEKFQREYKLDPARLEVVFPRSKKGSGYIRAITTLANIKYGTIDVSDVEYAPCLLNEFCGPTMNEEDPSPLVGSTVQSIIRAGEVKLSTTVRGETLEEERHLTCCYHCTSKNRNARHLFQK